MQAPADNTLSTSLSLSLTGVKADTASFNYPSFYQINKKSFQNKPHKTTPKAHTHTNTS